MVHQVTNMENVTNLHMGCYQLLLSLHNFTEDRNKRQ